MPVRAQLVRFGLFELDLETNELRKNGRKLKVQDQPFRLLNLLIENPGESVSRDRMKQALWSGDTFVDFDHSLNAAIAKLRQVLGDPAENPRFVETVARRGYRFIAPVEFVGASIDKVTDEPPPVIGEAAATNRNRRWPLLAIAASLTLAAFSFWWSRATNRPAETQLVRLTQDVGLNTDPAISPDGKLLAYASDRASAGHLNLWIQQLASGGTAVQLTHQDVDSDQPAFSPDGATIAFHSNKGGGGIYLIPAIGGEPSLLVQSGRSPRFSPDGRWIAYSSGAIIGGGVLSGNGAEGTFVIPASGGNPRRLGSDLSSPANPIWSPDGNHLLVYVPPKVGFAWDLADWWLISLDGGPSQRTGNFAALTKQGFSLGFDRVPRLAEWKRDSMTFAAGFGDSVNIWRAPLSADGRISGAASRLTSGTTLEAGPTVSASGRLIFASLNRNSAIWSLPADTDAAKVSGPLERVTRGPAELMPSTSADGRIISYTAARGRGDYNATDAAASETADLRTRIKDVSSGKETILADSGKPQWHPQISRDGRMVSYTAGKPGELFATTTDGRPAHRLVSGQNCFSWDWSLDNKKLLYNNCSGMLDQRLHMIEVASGRGQIVANRPGFTIFQAKFSPDDQAIALLGCYADERAVIQCRVFIVPFQNQVAAPPDRWIPINHASQWDDKPRWSPNGALLYFISDRDSFLCLWAQHLDKQSKQPIGLPFAVYHFHDARLAMSNLDTEFLEIAVARNKIFLGLGELTGDIWSAKKAH